MKLRAVIRSCSKRTSVASSGPVDYIHKCAAMLAETLAEGLAPGEFGSGDLRELARQTLRPCVAIHSPTMIGQCLAIRPEVRPEDAIGFESRALTNPRPLERIRTRAMTSLAPLAAVGLAFVAAACNQTPQAAKAAPPRPVLVAQAHFAPREETQVLAGVVKAHTESDLAFRVAGKLAARLVDAGALVREGDALARLDDTDFRLQLEEAEADESSAKAALTQAGAEERRLTTLSEQGWAANADFDRVHATADQTRAAVARANRAVALAHNAISYATLRADADGVITAVAAEPGQVVAAGAPIVRLAYTAEREAAISVPETLLDRVRSERARVEFWALPVVSVAAKLRELSPTSDPATRTYPARFSLIDAPADVRLGMSVTVLLSADAAKVARVPIAAVFDAGEGPSVWLVDPAGATLHATRVALAGYDSDSAFIGTGVPEGAKVVALGVHKLSEGEKVRVVENLGGL